MGVVGSGKTTVGTLLARKLGWQFADADDFHPPESVRKISHGIALTDADRAPWLARLRQAIVKWIQEGNNVVLACSALKRSYRDQLSPAGAEIRFVYLKGTYELIRIRLGARHGHFATASILKSQLHDLEEPEHATTLDIGETPEAIVAEIIDQLKPK
jgi:gluconokinase